MFDASALPDVVRVLNRREASLWHACQLTEFAAYLRLNGIASRAGLERGNLGYTHMVTDAVDRRNGYWDRTYFSLDDIGQGFARGWKMHPNVFGPIALQIAPDALLETTEAAFCPRSASGPGFDLQGESLSSPSEVDALFLHDVAVGFPLSAEVRFGEQLREALESPTATTIEILTSVRPPVLDLRYVTAVWVDPVTIGDCQLIDLLEGLTEQLGIPLKIRRRTLLHDSRLDVWRDITRLVADGEKPLNQVMNRADTSTAFREWAQSINTAGLAWVWERFARYLHHGTLRFMTKVTEHRDEPAPAVPMHENPRVASRIASSVVASAGIARPAVRACGHLAQAWDNGTCYACVGAKRSSWRYDH